MKENIIEYLITSGIVTQEQLKLCRSESNINYRSLVHCLVDKGFADAEVLAKAYAQYAGVSYIDKVTDKIADLTVLSKIPLVFLRENNVLPVVIEGKTVIVTEDPSLFQPLDELDLLLGGATTYAVASRKTILDGINRYYPIEGTQQMIAELEEDKGEEGEEVDFGDIDQTDIMTMAGEAPVIKLVNHILFQAVKRDASDIHIEPFEKEISVRYRIDGVMHEVLSPPKRVQGALVSRIKIMANLNIAEKRIPQDGRIEIKVADKQIDLRVSILPVKHGERVVMRLLDKSRTFGKLKDMGFSTHDLELIKKSIMRPNGIIYVTGPTGSGKTTTLYSVLGELNTPEVNILTVEDPVEYQMPGIGQVQVQEKIGMTFAAALRSILRQDPDIVMIGETRDQETAQIAIQAALTGHLVLSTLHTNNAPASITRLIDMGIEPFLIASSVVIIIAQRLVRKLCAKCKIPYTPSLELLSSIGLTQETAQGITFYQAQGCQECLQSGYRGRIAIFEFMPMTSAIAKLTMERSDTTVLRKQALKEGMTLLLDDGIRRIKEGLTTIDEVLSVATVELEMVE